ncbi:MAG: hypothetical protein JWM80_5695 [Cyanobacteria bacterium RYN_339]|nr:hypothetical protein [Cyanobacteria bacterium RYN_339]
MSDFTPERATRYVADTFPALLQRAVTHLGDGDHPEPTPEVARVALLSAREILDVLGAKLIDEDRAPYEAQLAALEKRFRAAHPELPLVMPAKAAPPSLLDAVQAAWERGSSPGPNVPAPSGSPGLDLPDRASDAIFPNT